MDLRKEIQVALNSCEPNTNRVDKIEVIAKRFAENYHSIQLMQTAVVGQGEQLVLFAEWLQYNGKYQLPEEQAKSFIKQQ